MKCLLNIMFTLFFFLMLPVWAWGVDHNIYIDSSATPAGDGSIGSPYDALSDINWTTVQGWVDGNDTVFINLKRGSRFLEMVAIGASGSSGYPIVIQAYGNGALPTIEGTSHAVYFNAKSYLYFDSLHFKGGTTATMQGRGSLAHINVNRCTFSDPEKYSILGYMDSNETQHDWSITGCTFSGNSEAIRFHIGGGENGTVYNLNIANCIFNDMQKMLRLYPYTKYFGKSENDKLDAKSSYGVTISNCVARNMKHPAIMTSAGIRDVAGHPNYIKRCSFSNIGSEGTDNVNALQLSWVNNLLVEDVVIEGVFSNPDRGDGNGVILDFAFRNSNFPSRNVTVRRCRVSGAKSCSYSGGIANLEAINSKIYYNIVYDNKVGLKHSRTVSTGAVFYGNVSYGNSIAGARLYGTTPAAHSIWKNNLFLNNPIGMILTNKTLEPTHNYNLFYHNTVHNIWDVSKQEGVSIGDNSITSDPRLADPANGDFTLQEGSPCIESGTDLGTMYASGLHLSTDWSTRPPTVVTVQQGDHGSRWDMGAYVYKGDKFLSPQRLRILYN